MIALLKYWQLIAGAVIGFILAWGIQTLVIDGIQAKAAKVLAAQMQFDVRQCQSAKDVTSKSESYYEDIIAKRDADLRSYKLRHPTSCIVPVTSAAGSGHATNVKSKSGAGNGIAAGALLDFAAECETDRAKTIALQEFILEERKLP